MKNKGKQRRSRETIQILLGAAAQVLIEQGYERSTTNRIAERAGYSVGTLYQYFNDKEDIYGELVDQELAKLLATTTNCEVQSSLSKTLQQWLALILQGLGQDRRLIQALEALFVGQFREKRSVAYEKLIASTVRLMENHRDEITVKDLQIAARIVVGATAGLSSNASLELLQSPDLEAHVLRLQVAYLTMKQ